MRTPLIHPSRFLRLLPFIGFQAASLLMAVLISGAAAGHLAAASPAASGAASKAVYVGSENCGDCHEEQVKALQESGHGRYAKGEKKAAGAKAGKAAGAQLNCETCHGPASLHVENPDKSNILNPAKLEGEHASAQCISCHEGDKNRMYWKGSIHSENEAGCASCHQIHGAKKNLLKKENEPETCFQCHKSIRADIMKRSKHPLRDSATADREGKMACSSCHNPHGAKGEKLIDAHTINDKCYECHTEKKAPMLWEHSPVKEDCLTCHAPHGSTNDKMLVTKVPRLCQQCHMQGRHQSGTLADNSVYALNRGCLNCHAMVHGSNNPSGAVLQR